MKAKIKLAILDDHQIVIDGLLLLLNDQQNIDVNLVSTQGELFLTQLKNKDIDIVLTDIIMPKQLDGITISKYIKEHYPEIKILVLSMNEDSKVIYQLIKEIEVDGFISKATGKEELVNAITTIHHGQNYFSREILSLLNLQLKILKETTKLHLSKREMEIVYCIIKRQSNKQIADELFISERTVETHRKNIYRKTNTKGEGALIEFLVSKGVI
jgi:two-component system, NarL family, nitrate/nitrite response regulator NarL